MSEDYAEVLKSGQLPSKQLPSHALEVPSEASIDLIKGGAMMKQVYSNPIVGPRIDSDIYQHYISQPASNGNLLRSLHPIQGGAYDNASNGFNYGHFYELQGGNMYRHQSFSSRRFPPPYNENLVGYGEKVPDEFCPEDIKGEGVNDPKDDLQPALPKLPGRHKHDMDYVVKKGKHKGALSAFLKKHGWNTSADIADMFGLGKGEAHALKRIDKMMGGALSPEEHEKLGSEHPAHGKKYRKYVLQLSDKTGGNVFGKVWEGLKKAHDWVKDKKILSKAARAIHKGAEFVSEHSGKVLPFAAYGGPKAMAAAAAIHGAAPHVRDYSKKAGDFLEEHGYGGMKGKGIQQAVEEHTSGRGIQPERVYINPNELVYQLSGVPPNASSGRIITGVTQYPAA